jgi:redox-sensitive bicupin YhaK (pirin superfamily)
MNSQNAYSEVLQKIEQVVAPREKHWVGDGFKVSTVFSPYLVDAQTLSPFVLMDHAAPKYFESAIRPRGVGEHPHRGFETVTFAYQGEVAHRDSHGGGGTIGSGDVQWMTAASGVVHEEFHSQAFTQTGGTFEMVQLWVNLPASDKMNDPRYQLLKAETFPRLNLGSAQARLIAGEFLGDKGPAKTHTPITMFDLEFDDAGEISFQLAEGTTTLLLMLRGDATAQDGQAVSSGEMVVFDRSSVGAIKLAADKGARALILNGEPLNEPVVAHGPFVMNTKAEIMQAMHDYRRGKMGNLQPKQESGATWES